MIVHNFNEENSILNQFVSELRDVDIQKDAMRFRKNLERTGGILGYELSKYLDYKTEEIKTPYGNKVIDLPKNKLVFCSVLRAGLPLHHGVLNYFDKAENAFISAYRDHQDNKDAFDIIVEYIAAPALNDKTLVFVDPMLATGRTLETVYEAMKGHGKPKQVHIISVIGSQTGVDYVGTVFPENTHLWIATIDDKLSNKGYIIPGLGDAGDLSYGLKL